MSNISQTTAQIANEREPKYVTMAPKEGYGLHHNIKFAQDYLTDYQNADKHIASLVLRVDGVVQKNETYELKPRITQHSIQMIISNNQNIFKRLTTLNTQFMNLTDLARYVNCHSKYELNWSNFYQLIDTLLVNGVYCKSNWIDLNTHLAQDIHVENLRKLQELTTHSLNHNYLIYRSKKLHEHIKILEKNIESLKKTKTSEDITNLQKKISKLEGHFIYQYSLNVFLIFILAYFFFNSSTR